MTGDWTLSAGLKSPTLYCIALKSELVLQDSTSVFSVLYTYTVEPRYLELAYLELPRISKWKSGPCFNMKLWQQVTK